MALKLLKKDDSDGPQRTTRYPLTQARLALICMTLKEGYSMKEALQFFRVSSRRTLQNWMNKGDLPFHDLPGHIRFTPEDFEECLRRSELRKRKK